MDGTFNTAPKLFKKLYVIHARFGQSAVTCVYALLTGKSQQLYKEMLQAISRAAEELGFALDSPRFREASHQCCEEHIWVSCEHERLLLPFNPEHVAQSPRFGIVIALQGGF